MVPSLCALSNDELKTRFELLRKKESEVIADVVLHLAELDARRYFRDLGYGSLFSYLTQGIGYSEGAAQRRIQAARCLREYPQVYGKLRAGTLSLCTVSEVTKAPKEQKERLLKDAEGKSKREVERLVALVRPPEAPKKESVKVRVVSVPPPVDSLGLWDGKPACPDTKTSPAGSAAEALKIPAPVTTEERYTVTFEVGKDFMKLLTEAKALGGGFSNVEVLTKALKLFVAKKQPKVRKKAATKASTATSESALEASAEGLPEKTAAPSRYIPRATRDAVYVRDGGRCTYVSKDGVRCAETQGLELDHCLPFALGGKSDEGNLCLKCRVHNILNAEKIFGVEKMARYRRG